MSLKCFWQIGFGWEPRALAPGLEILPLEDKARIENKKRIQKKNGMRYGIRSAYQRTIPSSFSGYVFFHVRKLQTTASEVAQDFSIRMPCSAAHQIEVKYHVYT